MRVSSCDSRKDNTTELLNNNFYEFKNNVKIILFTSPEYFKKILVVLHNSLEIFV